MSKYLFLLSLVLVVLAGCTSPQPPQPGNSSNYSGSHLTACADKQCFIAAAEDCNASSISVAEDYGMMKYETTTDCMFTKTLVKLDDNESADLKRLLEGKNMSCIYQKGGFDPRLVDTLIEGAENCTGELKGDLVKLAVFS